MPILLRALFILTFLLFISTSAFAQWTSQPSPGTYSIQSVQIIDEKISFLGTSGGVYRTIDGGSTWKRYRLQRNTVDSLYQETMVQHQINFFDANVGISAGWSLFNYGIILKTINGGIDWKIVHMGPQLGEQFDVTYNDIEFVNSKVGYVAGSKGTVMKTIDAGDTWSSVYVPLPAAEVEKSYFGTVTFLDEQTGYVAGTGIYKTPDGGKTWNKLATSFGYQDVFFYDLHFFDANNGVAALRIPQYSNFEDLPLYKTTDGGLTWAPVQQPGVRYESSGSNIVRDLYFTDRLNGYAIGDNIAWKTIDGGENWESLNFIPSTSLLKMHAWEGKKGIMVGDGGKIYGSTNFNEVTKPISRFTLPITQYYCPNTAYTFQNKGPQHYTYKWYVNNTLVSTDYNLTTTFEPDRNNEVKLVAENNGLTEFSIKHVRTEPTRVLQKISFAYPSPQPLYCQPASVSINIFGVPHLNYNSGDRARYELWAEGKLIEVIESTASTIGFKSTLIDKTITFTVKAIIQTHCKTYTQEESITYNVAPFPDLTLEVQEMEDVICPSSTDRFEFIIKNSQIGFKYAVKQTKFPTETVFDTHYDGNGGDLIIKTPFTGGTKYGGATLGGKQEITVYVWSNQCSSDYAKPLQDKAIIQTSDFNLKIEVPENQLLVNEPLRVSNLSVADIFKWTVTDGTKITEYNTPQLPNISFGTPGVKTVKLVVSKHDKCVDSVKFEVVVGNIAPATTLTVYSEDNVSLGNGHIEESIDYNNINSVIASHEDKDGFLYVTGSHKTRFFINKFDSSGKLVWSKFHYGGGYYGSSMGTTLISDDEGNVYVGGGYSTEIFKLDSIIAPYDSRDKWASFLLKINREGKTEWIIKAAAPGSYDHLSELRNHITDLAIDNNQHIYAVFNSTLNVQLSFPDGSVQKGLYFNDKGEPELRDEKYPVFLVKTDKQGKNLGTTLLLEDQLEFGWNESLSNSNGVFWAYKTDPQVEISKDNQMYIVGSRRVTTDNELKIGNYTVPSKSEFLQKYPDGGRQGYVAVMDLNSGNVEKAFNTYFHENTAYDLGRHKRWEFDRVPFTLTPNGIVISYSWNPFYKSDKFNNSERIDDRFKKHIAANEIIVEDSIYNNIYRGSLMAAYDWSGNNLWTTTSHNTYINDYYYDTNSAKILAFATLDSLSMIGSSNASVFHKVENQKTKSVTLLSYSPNGELLNVSQPQDQATNAVAYTMAVGKCSNLYLISGELGQNHLRYYNTLRTTETKIRSVALDGKCENVKTITVPFTQKYICKGESIQLRIDGSDILNVTWSPAASLSDPTSLTPTATPTAPTTYFANIETADGCTITRAVRIDIEEKLEIPDRFIVVSEIAYTKRFQFLFPEIKGGQRYEFEWTFHDGVKKYKNVNHEFPAEGTYTVSLRIWNDCTDKTITQQIKVPCTAAPIPTAGISFIRSGSEVAFKLTNPKDIETVFWEFGDGGTSTELEPVHTYIFDRSYNVRLTIRSACYENVYYKTISATCPTVNAVIQKQVNRQQVNFWVTGITSDQIIKWTFSDGAESTEKQPVHTFKEPGKYSATLLIQYECGITTRTIDVEVTCTNLAMDFSTTEDRAKVKFIPPVNISPITYEWDFGDGNKSTAASPEHTYMQSGKYLVWLKLTDACGTNVTSKEITVCTVPISADFTSTIDKNDSRIVSFRQINAQAGASYLWDFGDGTTSTEAAPLHRYAATGQYNVCLTTLLACSTATKCQEVNMPTALLDDINNKLFMIYPNPANEMLYFAIAPEIINTVEGIIVHDALGREVLTKSVKSLTITQMINTRELSPGSYYIRLSIKKGDYIIKKFVVQH